VRAYVGASGIRKDKDSLLGGSDFLRGMGDIDTRPWSASRLVIRWAKPC
jgi:hypothetical protein